MRTSLCVGEYSTTPYMIAGLDIHVYCVEELCYYIKENAFLIDTTLMNDGLLNWLSKHCGLKELADLLHPLVHRQGSFSQFVGTIEEFVGLYDEKTIAEICKVLKRSAGLTGIEKRKEQIDYLVEKKRFPAAIRGYDALLGMWDDTEMHETQQLGDELRAALFHNKGVALAGMMLYFRAGQSFMEAYRLSGDEKEYFCFLATKRMELGEKEYVAFASGQMEHYETAMELEKKINEIAGEFQEQPEFKRLEQLKEWRNGSEKQSYYEETALCIQGLKQSYRNCVGE